MVVDIYKDKNYGGTTAQIGYGRIGDVASETGVPNNSISAIKVGPFTKVTLYKDRYFAGRNVSISGPINIPDLSTYTGNLNNETSSILVERVEPTTASKMLCCTGQTSQGCSEFQHGSPLCKNVIATHCAQNITDPFCKAWCKQHPEICDNTVIAYCRQNPSDPYCSCINSKAIGIANPKCVDRDCITSGYLTKSMRDTACPSQVDCRMQVNLSNSGVNIASRMPIQQNCGDPYNSSRDNAPIVTGENGNSVSSIIIIIVLVFILLIFLAIVAAVSLSSQSDQLDYSDL